jgi:ribosome-binding protein aMBF1 (putative translation factor)
MVERCARCNISEDQVRLFDAIYDGRAGSICERCSIIENIPIIKRPDTAQLKESERGVGVYDRMKRLSGVKEKRKEDSFFIEDRLRVLNENPKFEIPEKSNLNLIEHFHWEIMKNRRRKGLSQQKLAENIGESEIVIQMLENAKLPENSEQLIKKIEQYLQIKLTKVTDRERFLRTERKGPVLLDSQGRELIKIPEPVIVKDKEEDEESLDLSGVEFETDEFDGYTRKESLKYKEADEEREKQRLKGMNLEKGEFEISDANLSAVRISDLKDLHRKKIEVTKREKIEEQKRIEERNRLIEARKEELRLLKEKESKELDTVLGGAELLKKDKGEVDKKFDEIEDNSGEA